MVIRLDVPYADDGTLMRATLLCFDPGFRQFPVDGVANIPAGIEAAVSLAEANTIPLDAQTTLVYPLDDRHGLAGVVLDESQRRGWKFARHVPGIQRIPADVDTAYESLKSGSAEESLERQQAFARVTELCERAVELFSTGMDNLPALGALRHALWLVLKHFSWASANTSLVLRNLGEVLNATGNADNGAEYHHLVRRMLHAWRGEPPDRGEWEQIMQRLERMSQLCALQGDENLARKVIAAAMERALWTPEA